jgi:hypothetical protein
MAIDPTKAIGNNPRDLIQVLQIDPFTRKPVAVGAFGRYSDQTGNSLVIHHQAFSAADNDTTEIVAAVPGYSIVVVGYIVQSGATAQTFVFESAATAISHTMQNGAYGGAVRPILNGGSYFSTMPDEALNGTTSSAAGAVTTGMVDYVLVPDTSLVDENGDPIVDGDGNPIS